MATVLRLASPVRQFGSVLGSRARLMVIASAMAASLVLAFSASAQADVTGPFCGASNAPRTFPPNSGCNTSNVHNLYSVEGHSTLSYAYMCAVGKGNRDGSGSNTLPANCGQVGTYAIAANCPTTGGCLGYAKVTNENSVSRNDWGYLYAFF